MKESLGFEDQDIEIIVKQLNVRPCVAAQALIRNEGDLVNAMLELTTPDTEYLSCKDFCCE